MSAKSRSRPRGYTLVEVLVVIAIIGTLMGLLIPAVLTIREMAQRTQCTHNLKQLATAFQNAANANDNSLPTGNGEYPNGTTNNFGTGFFHILPYLENTNLYKASLLGGFYDARNNGVQGKPLSVYQCHADPTVGAGVLQEYDGQLWATMSYAGNAQVFCQVYSLSESQQLPYPPAFYMKDPHGQPNLISTFSDGTSSTILFAEKYASCTYPGYWEAGGSLWAYCETTRPAPLHAAFAVSWSPQSVGPASIFQVLPNPSLCDPTRTSTAHRVMPVAMADGSVHLLNPSIAHDLWWALCTPNNGDLTTGNW